jgi:hypothetical protein
MFTQQHQPLLFPLALTMLTPACTALVLSLLLPWSRMNYGSQRGQQLLPFHRPITTLLAFPLATSDLFIV